MSVADNPLGRAGIGGGVTFIVLELAFLAVQVPAEFSGFKHFLALLAGLVVFIAVLLN